MTEKNKNIFHEKIIHSILISHRLRRQTQMVFSEDMETSIMQFVIPTFYKLFCPWVPYRKSMVFMS